MTLQRPNVVVFQEYATITVVPDIPDLNVLIVGPAKQLLDYLDDKSLCYASEYGTYQGNCPMIDPVAVVFSEPPNLVAGGTIDPATVSLYFDDTEVVILEPDLGVTPAKEGRYTSGDNLFWAHTSLSGQHFGTPKVAPGDVAIIENSGTEDFIMTVKELCYTIVAPALNFLGTNPVQDGDILTIAVDTAPISRDGVYTVKRVVDSTTLEVTAAAWVGTFSGVATANVSITDAYGTPRFTPVVGTALEDYCNLRMTSDFTETAGLGTLRKWRIERKVDDLLLDASDFVLDGNSITVNGAITVDLDDMPGGPYNVSYAKIYVQYAAFRTDLERLITYSSYSEIEAGLGKYDARNPLMVGAVVAKGNTSTPIKVYGVPDNTYPSYLEFLDRISVERDIYAIVPLTYSTSILAAIKSNCENLADPQYALDNGTKQKFRVVIGALELVTEEYMVNPVGGCSVSMQSGTAPSGNKTGTITLTGVGTLPDFFAMGPGGAVPGDKVEIRDVLNVLIASYTIAQTNDNTIFEADEVITAATYNTAGDYLRVMHGITEIFRMTVAGLLTEIKIAANGLDNLYLILTCPTATFLTDGVIAGDVLQIPDNPTTNVWTGTVRYWTVAEVISNQKLRIVNGGGTSSGNNTSTLEKELPHGGRRSDGTEITGYQYCRILRNMDKTQQVSYMVAVAQSFSSRRTLLCFPDLVDITDLVDGSLERITNPLLPEAAGSQPGYYLACAVGGQTAGQPPQQGFTYLGISGVDRIYHSAEYFSEEQLTDLSNGGVYVFVQDNPSALPYSIHEVTTDVSALEFGEYMVIKDFDFVAWTFLDTLLPFIGRWNVTKETIEFIRQALYTTANNLKARKVAKIGSPLLDYQIDSVAPGDSKDRIEAYMQVTLPMTLNVIGLHLVA
jgi:hypothetical protein